MRIFLSSFCINTHVTETSMWHNTDDAVLATIDAMKSICQLLIVKRIVTADELAHSFEHQGEGYLAKRNPSDASSIPRSSRTSGSAEACETSRARIGGGESDRSNADLTITSTLRFSAMLV
jgi:hypothetical protein